MCHILKCQVWVIMHIPCICIGTPHCTAQSAYPHWSCSCLSEVWAGAIVPFFFFFADPDFQEQWCWTQAFHGTRWQHQVLLWSNVKNAITDYCFCGPPDSPWLGLAQRVFQYPCMRPAGNLCTHGFLPGGKSSSEVGSLPTCCRSYSWNQDRIQSNFFHQKY